MLVHVLLVFVTVPRRLVQQAKRHAPTALVPHHVYTQHQAVPVPKLVVRTEHVSQHPVNVHLKQTTIMPIAVFLAHHTSVHLGFVSALVRIVPRLITRSVPFPNQCYVQTAYVVNHLTYVQLSNHV